VPMRVVSRIRVLLAEDKPDVAEELAALLEDHFQVVGIVHNGQQLIAVAKELKPAIIVTDISMPLLNGLDAVRRLRGEGVQTKVVVLTQHKQTQFVVEAFRAGVSAYLLKHAAGDELVKAIHEVLQGRTYVSGLITKDLTSILTAARSEGSVQRHNLTARQREILQFIAEGKTARDIAVILNISPLTAEGHKRAIMDTFGVRTIKELVQHAIKLGLISS
jgi:DNA-binding NarL/FixJ family response regulator